MDGIFYIIIHTCHHMGGNVSYGNAVQMMNHMLIWNYWYASIRLQLTWPSDNQSQHHPPPRACKEERTYKEGYVLVLDDKMYRSVTCIAWACH